MKKEEFIHLHTLFVVLWRQLDESGEVPTDAFDEYRDYDVEPMALHRRKSAHQEAIDRLLDGILVTITTQRQSTGPATQQPADTTSHRNEREQGDLNTPKR